MQFFTALLISAAAALVAAAPAPAPAAGDQKWGPSRFCQGLSPGGGDSCIDIPEGCYIVEPGWNFVPPVVCP
ncbi:hypothetical protein EDC01DRAFT_666821 [Geopyxis carbonaria]|nr:hypothetical protein EDC01DRAFT_666821 [Geopyxis carbonaria]